MNEAEREFFEERRHQIEMECPNHDSANKYCFRTGLACPHAQVLLSRGVPDCESYRTLKSIKTELQAAN